MLLFHEYSIRCVFLNVFVVLLNKRNDLLSGNLPNSVTSLEKGKRTRCSRIVHIYLRMKPIVIKRNTGSNSRVMQHNLIVVPLDVYILKMSLFGVEM